MKITLIEYVEFLIMNGDECDTIMMLSMVKSKLGNWSYLGVPDQVLGMFIGSWPTVQLQDFKMAKDLFSRSSEAVIVIWTDFIFNCYKESIQEKKK